MPHAVEVLKYNATSQATTIAFVDDGGSRPGCVGISQTSTQHDAPCWSRALVVDLSFAGSAASAESAETDWEATITLEWASPIYDYWYTYNSANYEAMADADSTNFMGGNINYLGDVGGGDRYLVAFVDIVNASYCVWEVQVTTTTTAMKKHASPCSRRSHHEESEEHGHSIVIPSSRLGGTTTTITAATNAIPSSCCRALRIDHRPTYSPPSRSRRRIPSRRLALAVSRSATRDEARARPRDPPLLGFHLPPHPRDLPLHPGANPGRSSRCRAARSPRSPRSRTPTTTKLARRATTARRRSRRSAARRARRRCASVTRMWTCRGSAEEERAAIHMAAEWHSVGSKPTVDRTVLQSSRAERPLTQAHRRRSTCRSLLSFLAFRR